MLALLCRRDHNATSYSTETSRRGRFEVLNRAENITLRAIALKLQNEPQFLFDSYIAEIITLRAIALKPLVFNDVNKLIGGRDHNATSYSTETNINGRSIAGGYGRDHNATSYSTETAPVP